jgi:hypothetical protein
MASGERQGRGRHRQPPVSLFEEPAQESDEYKALKNIFDDPAEKSRGTRNEGRGVGGREHQQEGRYSKRQPIVVVDDVTLEDEEWQEVDNEPVVVEERPRRNRRGGSFDGQRNDREQRTPATGGRNFPPKRGGVISGDRVVQHDIDEPTEDRNVVEGGGVVQRSYTRSRGGSNVPQRNTRGDSRHYGRDDRDHNTPDGGRNYAPPKTRGERVTEREPIVEQEYESDNDSAFVDDEDNQVQLHRNMPGWGEAIDDIIAGNITRHRNSQPYRGRR